MEELKHHGIKGQKWGVQNGPPYPLDESQYSGQEKKLAKIANKHARQAADRVTTAIAYQKVVNATGIAPNSPKDPVVQAVAWRIRSGIMYTGMYDEILKMKYQDILDKGNELIENGKKITTKVLSGYIGDTTEAIINDVKRFAEKAEKEQLGSKYQSHKIGE